MNHLVESYNNFQNNFGQRVELDYPQIVNSLFSRDFKKIANGVELVSDAEGLLNQLQSVMEAAGSWVMDIKDSVSSVCGKKHVVSYILKSEKLRNFGVIAIITVSNDDKIDSIYEVYHQF